MKYVFGVVAIVSASAWGSGARAQADQARAPASQAQTPPPPEKRDTDVAVDAQTDPAKAPQSAQPGEIVVQGQKSAVTRTADGVSYDQRNNPQAQAGSAADVLNTVPSVAVSPDGAVTLRGNANVQVYVNGRPTSAMDGENRATTLQSMSGDSIASVEVITNPSAKVDASGGTIINLILKQGATTGPRATVTANAGDRRRGNAALDSAYGWSRLHLDLDASVRDDVRLDGIIGERRYVGASGNALARSTVAATYSPTHRRSTNVGSELRYALTPAADIGAKLDMTRSTAANIVRSEQADFDAAGLPLSQYERVRDGRLEQLSRTLSVYFVRRGSGRKASVSVDLQDGVTHGRSDRTYATTYAFPAVAPSLEYVGDYKDSRLTRAAVDVEKALDDTLSFSVGAEWKRNENRFLNNRTGLALGSPFPHGFPGPATVFSVVQNSGAAYVNAKAQLHAWTIQAGLRARTATLRFSAIPVSLIADRSITGFNGNLSITRDVGPGQLSLALTRSQQLPDARDLNPAILYIDGQNRYSGNPALRPQEVSTLEFGYDVTRHGINGSAKLYYRRTDRTIVDEYVAIGADIVLDTKHNAGRSQSYGAELSLSGKVLRGVKVSTTVNLFNSELSFVNLGVLGSNARLSYTAQGSVEWSVTQKDVFRLDANAQSPGLIPQGVRSGGFAVNAVWRHDFSSDLSVSLTAQRLAQNSYVHTDIATATFQSSERRRNGSQALLLGLRYRIR